MALVEVKEVVRRGLVQNVCRYISPPNPSSLASCLWKTDSLSRKKRDLIMARATEIRTFFTTSGISPVAELHTHAAAQMAVAEVPKEGANADENKDEEADALLYGKTYGQDQGDHKKVADRSHEHYEKTKDEGDSETLEDSGFDISRKSSPSGAE